MRFLETSVFGIFTVVATLVGATEDRHKYASILVSPDTLGVDDPEGVGEPGRIVKVSAKSLKAHHTDHYEVDEGSVVVRRGQSFDMIVETSTLNASSAVSAATSSSSIFEATACSKVNSTHHSITFTTSVNSSIGKYENELVTIANEAVPLPRIYLLFNPWLKADKTVYLPKEKLRQEHVVADYGLVFDGSLKSYRSIQWYYGPSQQVALDAAFHVLKTLDDASDPVKVVAHISQNQGFHYERPDGKITGNPDGLLEGKWDGEFVNGTDPDSWTSTIDILNIWKETNEGTRYGQCWIFAALQTTLTRTIGIGSRQLSAFGARVDASKQIDGKVHHVVDQFYDKFGKSVDALGMVWNYHSWNDVYLNRETKKYSGWQSLDGTPPGLGPASVKAVKKQEEDDTEAGYNMTMFISTVHATVRTFLVECQENHTKMDGCEIIKRIKYEPEGVKKILSSKTLKNGTLAESDITKQYVDPNKDAFIPFDDEAEVTHTSTTERVQVIPDSHRVQVGNAVTGHVNVTANEGSKVALTTHLTNERGEVVRDLSSSTHSLEKSGILQFEVPAAEYLDQQLTDRYVKVIATVDSGDTVTMETATIVLEAPKLVVFKESGGIVARMSNPYDFTLEDACLEIRSHTSNFSMKTCKTLKPRETAVIRTNSTVTRPVIVMKAQYIPTEYAYLQH